MKYVATTNPNIKIKIKIKKVDQINKQTKSNNTKNKTSS